MKQEQVKKALYEAFDDYWKSNGQIVIDGHPKNKIEKKEHLYFDESCILRLTQAIGCQEELPKLYGKVKAYIVSNTPKDSKSAMLSFSIRNTEYIASYNKEDDVVSIIIQNIGFQERKL